MERAFTFQEIHVSGANFSVWVGGAVLESFAKKCLTQNQDANAELGREARW